MQILQKLSRKNLSFLFLVIIQMKNIRQLHRKQSSLQHPSTSLHLMQVSKFIEQYFHTQQKYLINFSTGSVQTHLPLHSRSQNHSFDIDLNVPYIQSEHYDSRATFTDQSKQIYQHSEQFTQLQDNSMSMDKHQTSQKKKMLKINMEDDIFNADDFKFIKQTKSPQEQMKRSSQNNNSLPFYSTNTSAHGESRTSQVFYAQEQQQQLQHLQETAYFLHQKQRVDRKLKYQTKSTHENNENISIMNQSYVIGQTEKSISKKAIFLNKIEKQKSRKEIVEAINREKHHIKRFLK